jgi:hypothetical protein
MNLHELAGKPEPRSMLVDVTRLPISFIVIHTSLSCEAPMSIMPIRRCHLDRHNTRIKKRAMTNGLVAFEP